MAHDHDDNPEYDKHLLRIDIVIDENPAIFKEKLQRKLHDLQLAGFQVDDLQFQVDHGMLYGLVGYAMDVDEDELESILEDTVDPDDEF